MIQYYHTQNRVGRYAFSAAWTGSCHADEWRIYPSAVYPPHPTVAEEHDMRLSLLSPPRYGDVNLYQEVFFYEKNSYAAEDNGGAFPARGA